ncbi:hypothetical protein ABZW96_07920 [Nocardia sp. NPDC004168]|uniref:hypothetical protein n=1 Tax=Nocardia TaxID=1817 RepID=UPI0033BC83A4
MDLGETVAGGSSMWDLALRKAHLVRNSLVDSLFHRCLPRYRPSSQYLARRIRATERLLLRNALHRDRDGLAAAVTLAEALAGLAGRLIACGSGLSSGRYRVDLETLLPGAVLTPPIGKVLLARIHIEPNGTRVP